MRLIWTFAALFSVTVIGVSTARAQIAIAGGDSSGNEVEESAAPADLNSKPRLLIETGAFNSQIRAIAFSGDGQYVGASTDSDIRIWEVETGELYHTIRGFSKEDSGIITSLAVDPQNNYLAVAVLTEHGSYVRTCALDNLDVTAGYWGNPEVPGQLGNGVTVGKRSARHLTFSGDGKYLAFVSTYLTPGENGFGLGSSYMLFDWEKDEMLLSEPVTELEEGEGYDELFGTSTLPQAGFFFGSNRYYIQPFFGEAYDAVADESVSYDASPELQWYGRLEDRVEQYYQNVDGFVGHGHGDVQKRKFAVAYSAKKNGRDYYQCDIFSGENASPTASYKGLLWAPSDVKVSYDGQRVAVGDALGNVYVLDSATGKPIFRSKSIADSMYAASLDQSKGILAFGNRPNSGADWKFNDYAKLKDGFDLRNRRLIESPEGDFPRAKTTLYGVTTTRMRNDKGQFVNVVAAGQEDFATTPFVKPFFTYTLAKGNHDNEVMMFRGGSVSLVADAIKIGAINPRPGVPGRGNSVAAGSIEKSSVASDVNLTKDDRFVTAAWTDGSVCIYRKSDFETRTLGRTPYAAVPTGSGTEFSHYANWRVSEIYDQNAVGDLRVGDIISGINGSMPFAFAGQFMNMQDGNEPGDVLDLTILRGDQEVVIPVTLLGNGVPSGSYVQPVLTFFTTKRGDWILFTPEGYYDASLGGHDLIGWKVNRGPDETANFFSARQLRQTLYRPDVIDQVIEAILNGDPDGARPDLNKVVSDEPRLPNAIASPTLDLRNQESFQSILPPTVAIQGAPEDGQVAGDKIKLTIVATPQNNLPVKSVVLLVNGRPPTGVLPKPQQNDDGSMTLVHTIALPEGRTDITAIATNSAASSSPSVVSLTRQGGDTSDVIKPKMFVLAIGVADYLIDDYDLQFAAKDATAFAAAFKSQEGKFYREVETKILTDAGATRSAIQDGMDWLYRSVTQNDIAVVFISGHGEVDSRKNFYFCNHETDAERLRATALSYTEIERMVQEMPCKILLFADTCHSGSTRGAKSLRDPWADLVSSEVGAIMFASSTVQEESLERDEWGHGAFTYAFLEAMRKKETDQTGDGYISITELELSIAERVRELTDGQQHPTTQKPPTIRNFNLAVSGTE
ncbi:Caspase domain protein [Stieleria varia]|uniref:Caspase domain protein n=2 Tax=Stieleria varia TaxID=2528005 RepID=A0A5C6B8E2_9BACT|nr:Caspase domain protein [Stieleria varia]